MYHNAARLPESLFYLLTHSDYKREEGVIGVTTLIDSPRIRVLTQKYEDMIEREASDGIYALLGTAVHKLLASYPYGISEERLYHQSDGWKYTLAGTPDLIEHSTLFDYKTTSTWISTFGIRDEWVAQLNVYRLLKYLNDPIPISSLQVVAIYRDWTASKIAKFQHYPPYPSQVFDVPMWTMRDTRTFVDERMRLHEEAETKLPMCTASERWLKPSVFAVHIRSKIRAEKLCNSFEEAVAWTRGQGHDGDVLLVKDQKQTRGYCVVKRPEEWKRCEKYCPVSRFCAQYQDTIHATGL